MPGAAYRASSTPVGAYRRNALARYSLAVMCALSAALLRWLLDPVLDEHVPWLFFFPAVVISALYGRFAAGALTTLMAVVLTVNVWVPPLFPISAQRVEPWISVGGFVSGALLMSWVVEITHRSRRELEFERRFLDTVFSSLTDGLVVLDSDWRYIYVNDAATSLSRKTRAEFIGRLIWDLYPQLKRTVFEQELLRSRREKVPVHFEMNFGDRWLEFRAHPMEESTVIYVTDISRRKQAATQLAEAKEQLAHHASNLECVVHERTISLEDTVKKLEESVAELQRFSYTISHDLRAPLRAMQSFASLIAEDYGEKLDAAGHDYLRRIQNAAQRMDRLINDVLLYTRTSRADIELKALDLDPLVDEIVAQYTPTANGHIDIRHPLGRVWANEALVTQVVSNLMVNAVKFVAPGAEPLVQVWAERNGENVRLFFRDQGIGIPPEAREKIFGIFERAHGERYAGTGMGLAIVKRAVERMNGLVGFESEVGKGSTFWVDLRAGDSRVNVRSK